jgi:ABC-2 type transport system ATP-binding protein
MQEPFLEVRGLTKRYGGPAARPAVDALSLAVPRGQRFGLLGPNGAGKTTTISAIVGALKPDAGTVTLDGKPVGRETDPAKRRIGYVPQELALYDDLTAADNLRLFGALYGLVGADLERRVCDELEAVGLAERAKSRVKTFSGGMKRRLNIAAALLHRPDLLILDEPTVGVDPQSRNAIFERIERLADAGMTLLYTSHYMEEVERLCDRVAVMDHGRVIADGTHADLRALLPARDATRLLIEVAPDAAARMDDATLAALRAVPGVAAAAVATGGRLDVSVADLTAGAPAVLAALAERGIAYTSVVTERPGLEEVFLHLTGRSLRDA